MNRPASIHRVPAHNAATDSENRIHDDRVAAAHGFRGGLVPGVTVYGYMVPAILDRLGREWLEIGGVNFRLVAPCYEGEIVVTRCDGATVAAEREDGALYASGTVSLDGEAMEQLSHIYPAHPAPESGRRPVASPATVVAGEPLGSIRRTIETHDPAGVPECLLHWANQILMANFVMSAWIHAASHVRHHRSPALGEQIEITGKIEECFERKGRRFAVAGLSFQSAGGPRRGELVAGVRHTFIYQL